MSKVQSNGGICPRMRGIREIEKLQAEQDKIISGVTSTPKTTSSNTTWIKTTTGGLKEIDLSFPLKTYTPTGNATLDKELLTDYKGSITKAKNNVMEAWQAGAITKEEAIVQLEKVSYNIQQNQKSPRNPKSPKPSVSERSPPKRLPFKKFLTLRFQNPNWER